MIKTIAFQFLSREVLVIAIAILVLFGGTRLPQIGRLLGRSLKEFRKGLRNAKDEFEEATRDFKEDEEPEDDDPADSYKSGKYTKDNRPTADDNDGADDENRPAS